MATTVDLALDGYMRFRARTSSGHAIELDTRLDGKGGDGGARPVEAVLAALGACSGMDVISILRRMRQDITSYDVRLSGERRPEHPRVFTSIDVVHVMRGRDLSEDRVRRAIFLSISQYCPVYAMLSPAVPISTRYELTDEHTGTVRSGAVTPGETP